MVSSVLPNLRRIVRIFALLPKEFKSDNGARLIYSSKMNSAVRIAAVLAAAAVVGVGSQDDQGSSTRRS